MKSILYFKLIILILSAHSLFSQVDLDYNAYKITFEEPEKPAQTVVTNNTPKQVEFKLEYQAVQTVMDTIILKNKNIKKSKGYRIAVYNGNNKEEIKTVKEFVYSLYPNINIISEYKQPNYRIKVGDFLTRFEAFEVLAKINTQYTDALIVPEIVDINPPTINE